MSKTKILHLSSPAASKFLHRLCRKVMAELSRYRNDTKRVKLSPAVK